MAALLVTVAVIGVVSVVLGQGAMRLAGEHRWSWLSAAVGFAVLTLVCSVGVRLPGHAVTARVLLLVVTAAAVPATVAAIGRPRRPGPGAWTALLVLLGALLPFAANGRVGILGVLDNADLSAHLVLADAIRTGATPVAVVYAEGGYPTGPHAVAATLTAFGTNVETSFTALLIAVPVLTATCALSVLREVPMPWRAVAAAVVGLPYLGAAFLAQSSFKEPMQALLVIGFAAVLHELVRGEAVARVRSAIPLYLLAAATVTIYSFVGLAWPAGGLACWALFAVVRRRGLPSPASRRQIARHLGVGLVVLVLVALPELARVGDLLDDVLTVGAGDTVGGNIEYPIAPYQVLGVSFADDLRAGVKSVFAPPLAALAVVAMVGSSAWWARRRELAFPAVAAASLLGYALARAFTAPYYDAKALMIASPLVVLVVVRALTAGLPEWRTLRRSGPVLAPAVRWPPLVLAVAFLTLAAVSSSLVLRAARVQAGEQSGDLAEIRPLVQGAPTLFLGQEDYAFWQLRGARLSTVRSYIGISQIPFSMRPEKPLSGLIPLSRGRPLDFDNLDHANLDRFRFVVTTRAPYSSAPPGNWRLARQTGTYSLWRRDGATLDRQLLPESADPGAVLDCRRPAGRRLSGRAGWAGVRPRPVVAAVGGWSLDDGPARVAPLGHAEVPAGQPARQALRLPPGQWDLSLQYISSGPLDIEGPGLRTQLPPSTARGGPYWPAGRVESRGGTTWISVRAGSLSRLSRRRGVSLGSLAATRADRAPVAVPLEQACERYVDWYVLASPAAGR